MRDGKKIYLIDTNVFLYDPKVLFSFDGSDIGVPVVAIEELDQFKTEKTKLGLNARETIRILDKLRAQGSLVSGVALENGSLVKIVLDEEQKTAPDFLNIDSNDNKILRAAFFLKEQGYKVSFISKDLNARIKSDVLGIETHDYLNEDYISKERFYKGWQTLSVPSVQLKKEIPQGLVEFAKDSLLNVNEFVLVQSQNNSFNYRIFRYLGGKKFKSVIGPDLKLPFGPKNPQQAMALDLLLDDSIQFVSIFGPAGTGKTFLALVAGLEKVLFESLYKKFLVLRPIVPLGADIGFLPGYMEEKLRNWMQPIYDNMDYIVHGSKNISHFESDKGKKNDRKDVKKKVKPLDDLIKDGRISLDAITYMRGRSIPNQLILIDEVQNLSSHEVKTLITRVGEGSKVILAGDPYQIDSPYLNFSNNGLVVASNKFKGQKIFGSVFLEESERSELSKLAGELL